MVKGIETFRDHFSGFEDQYVLIGGAACDVVFSSFDTEFRSTRDLDIVLIIEAITQEFGERFWDFIKAGKYRNKTTSNGKPQFYRFDKPEDDTFPKMIELFSRNDLNFDLAEGLTPIHIDDSISSLSAILLDEDYYKVLLDGRTICNGLSVLT